MNQFTSSCAATGTPRLFLLHSIPMPAVLRNKNKNKQKYSEERSQVFLNSLFWVRILPGDSCLTYGMCIRDEWNYTQSLLFPPFRSTFCYHSGNPLTGVSYNSNFHYHLIVPQLSPEETNIPKKLWYTKSALGNILSTSERNVSWGKQGTAHHQT